MQLFEHIKKLTKKQTVNAIIGLTPYLQPEMVLKLTAIAAKIPKSPTMEEYVTKARQNILQGDDSQGKRLFKRVLTELSPHCLKTVARSLFVGALLDSANARDAFAAEHGFTPPSTLLISPTMRCNLTCQGCYSGKYLQQEGLPYDLLHRVVGEAHDLGIRFIVLSGGEPLSRKQDLFRLAAAYNRDMYFMCYTNGTLISEDTADELARLGNMGAIISLEGFEAATDARRGKGVFQRAMDAMDRLKARGIPFGSSLTVTSRNIEEITSDAFFDHLYRKGVMLVWYFLFMPVGKDPDTTLMPNPEHREYLRQRDKALRAKFPIFIADFWNDAPYVGGCIAGGRNYFHINAKGDVEPCVFCHTAVDSVYDKSLGEVLKSEFFQKIRSHQPHSENMLTPCMIIDNPHIYRDAVQTCGAYPTHDGADDLLVKIPERLDAYSQRVHQYLDPIWKRERNRYGYKEPIDLPDNRHEIGTILDGEPVFKAEPLKPDNGNGAGQYPVSRETQHNSAKTPSSEES
jgi:MoaA/NifB/PqqE/SkfB family radical SAM enzyme